MSMAEKTEESAEIPTEVAESDDGISDVAKSLNAAFDAAEGTETETEPVVATTTEPVAAQDAVTDRPAADAAAATTEAAELLSPPGSWSPETKAKFASLDPLVQKEVLKREGDFHKGIEEYKSSHKAYREIMDVVAPYMPIIQAQGGTPVSAINNLLNTAYQLQQNPASVIQRLARQYNVPMGDTEQQQIDPMVSQLIQKVQSLEGTLLQGKQAQEQMSVAQANDEITKFASDPKNIYFQDVRNSMASLIQTGEASDIRDAYNKACRLNDKVFTAVSEQERAANEQKRIQEAKQKAANAKRAAFDVSGSGAVSNGKSELSLRDQLEAAFPQ